MCDNCNDDKCRICAVCGKGECEHHPFMAVNKPEGCVCDPNSWGDPTNLPPVCDEYKGDGIENCMTCEHDKECHKKG
jgi:hypothetical protein